MNPNVGGKLSIVVLNVGSMEACQEVSTLIAMLAPGLRFTYCDATVGPRSKATQRRERYGRSDETYPCAALSSSRLTRRARSFNRSRRRSVIRPSFTTPDQ